MGIVERKEREKQDMRDLILEVAGKMFLEKGYDKTSIRNIAEAIEYSPATIYLYYKDKDEIFFELHNYAFAKLLKAMQSTLAIENPYERLIGIGKTYTKFALDNPEYYDLMFILRAPMKNVEECEDDEWNNGRLSLQFLEQTVQQCMEQGLIKQGDVRAVAFAMWSMVHGQCSLIIRNRIKMYKPEEFDHVLSGAFGYMMNAMKIG